MTRRHVRTNEVLLVLILFAIVCLAMFGCVTPGPNPPPPPPPQPTRFQFSAVVKDTAREFVQGATVTVGERALTTNQYGFAEGYFTAGIYDVTVTAEGHVPVPTAPIRIDRHLHRDFFLDRARPRLSRVRTEGRFFVNDAGTFRPVWTSGLALLARTDDERRAFLRWAAEAGFNGVRVFAGDLGWAGQTPETARAALPALLADAEREGLYAYVVANTGTASGYDVRGHTAFVANLCAGTPACVLEVANEIGHSSQSALVNDPRRLEAAIGDVIPAGLAWSLGAMLGQDEPDPSGVYPPNGRAPFNTAHLDRGRVGFDQIRRVREIAAISENTGKPALSGEPIGAAEVAQPGRRESDPNFFFAYGALCRMFEVGCVFHSEDGLNGRLLGPVQHAAAESFIAGFRAISTNERLSYRNSGWAGSDVPVRSFAGAIRVYAGIRGNEGWVVVVGDQGATIEWNNGWRPTGTAVSRPGVRVIPITR